MRVAIEADDTDAVKSAAHQLKGGCLTLAASYMAELCDDLETLAASGVLDHAPALVDTIESAFIQAHAALLAEFAPVAVG
jgi:HPt (histidine-containing phosphotransfer) domain-containing protein